MLLLVFIVPLKPIHNILHIQGSAMKRVSPADDNVAAAKSQRIIGLPDDVGSPTNVHVLPFSASLSNATAITAAPPHELSDMPYLSPSAMLLEWGYADNGAEYVRLKKQIVEHVPRKMIFNGEVGDWRLDDKVFVEQFELPGQSTKFDMLSHMYPLARDKRIEFIESTHVYRVDQKIQVPRSVTQLVHQFQEPFDAPTIIEKMKNGKRWPEKREEYLKMDGNEMSSEEIQAKWDANKEMASKRGTLLHWYCEMFLNGAQLHGPFSTEFRYFLKFYKEFMLRRGIVPVRTELSVFHAGLGCAGQLDLLAKYHNTESYVIFDWKRSKEIKTSNVFRNLLPPLEHLEDTNFNTYSLQLNLYKYILETEYGLRIDELYLASFHECNEAPDIRTVDFMPLEINAIIEYEKTEHNAQDPHDGPDAPFSIAHMRNFPEDHDGEKGDM